MNYMCYITVCVSRLCSVCLCSRICLFVVLSMFEDVCISLLLTVTCGNISIRPA